MKVKYIVLWILAFIPVILNTAVISGLPEEIENYGFSENTVPKYHILILPIFVIALNLLF